MGASFIPVLKAAFWATIYIQITFDFYIYRKLFIYKLKSFYIQIENDLYINRDPNSGKADSDHKEPVFSSFSPQNPVLFKCLFRIIPNSSSLLKTFFGTYF
ncbi:hypothetical protein CS374_00875 [Porphyromonas gingivalis]|nr:hypothetical protein CS374_00875 [Porphyromonas gingivalis]